MTQKLANGYSTASVTKTPFKEKKARKKAAKKSPKKTEEKVEGISYFFITYKIKYSRTS